MARAPEVAEQRDPVDAARTGAGTFMARGAEVRMATDTGGSVAITGAHVVHNAQFIVGVV